ncbi:aldose 1-epimerase [Fretibacter rubidus]|uniref:aldose 1-epimerase n=1 Tax=Fretibacter rubidus TaxID=570162 RepID=UPI00352BBAAE
MAHVTLKNGKSELTLSPDSGAAVLRFTHDGQEMFKSVEAGWKAARDPLKTSCFPLIPYSNRIRDGRFHFGGEDISLEFHETDHGHALHGLGWVRPWTVTQQSERDCVCSLNHTADIWPWAFHATQSLELSDGRLSMTVSITNESSAGMPAGIGTHPYFPNKKNARLQFNASGVWLSDEAALPTIHAAIPEPWDFTQARKLKDVVVDNCFTGFSGQASIRWDNARYGMDISADEVLGFAVVYVPEEQDYFCFEPVSHMNDAVNFEGKTKATGLRVLSPGETVSATTNFTVADNT